MTQQAMEPEPLLVTVAVPITIVIKAGPFDYSQNTRENTLKPLNLSVESAPADSRDTLKRVKTSLSLSPSAADPSPHLPSPLAKPSQE